MASPTFVPERREIWYSDGNSGFWSLRLTNNVWRPRRSAAVDDPADGPTRGLDNPDPRPAVDAAAGTPSLPATGSVVPLLIGVGLLAAAAGVAPAPAVALTRRTGPCRSRAGSRASETESTQGSSVIGWVGNIEQTTLDNETFRTVVHTGDHLQLTVMRLAPGEDIGREAHPDLDQFIRIERGQATVELGTTEDAVDETHAVQDDWAVIIPAGTWHNVINTGSDDVKLYSIYAPPEHPADTVHQTKAEADAAEAENHGS
jgi:mannose-6-phosphate isomerase-like protein (cupin superfamily)